MKKSDFLFTVQLPNMDAANVFTYNIAYPFKGINDVEKVTNEGRLYDNRFIDFVKHMDKIDLLTNAEQVLFPTKRVDKVEKIKADIEKEKQKRNSGDVSKPKSMRSDDIKNFCRIGGKVISPGDLLTKNHPTITFIKERIDNARNDIDKNKLMLMALKEITDDIIREGTNYIELTDTVLAKHEKALKYSVDANVKTATAIKNQELLNTEMKFIIDEQQQRIHELERKLMEQEKINQLNSIKIDKIIDILEKYIVY